MTSNWLQTAQRIQAIGQTGLTYSEDPYDTERYQELVELASKIIAGEANIKPEVLIEKFALDLPRPSKDGLTAL